MKIHQYHVYNINNNYKMTNHVRNGNFSSYTGNSFDFWSQSSTRVELEEYHSAPAAIELGSPTGSCSQSITGLIPNATYNLTFYSSSSFNFNTSIIARITGPSGTILNETITQIPPYDEEGYTRYSFDFTTPDANVTLIFLVNLLGVLLDDVSIVLLYICFSGNSLVHARNIETGIIEDVRADKIVSGIHEVFSVNKNKFIPVTYNIVTGPTDKFRKIKKDSLGENQPSEDFYITSGHKIIYKGNEIKVRNVPGSKRHKLKKPEMVYSICVDEHEPILVNNLPVIAWGYEEWLKRLEKKKLFWKDNRID